MTGIGMKILKKAVAAPDTYFSVMQVNPEWHGYTVKTPSSKDPTIQYHNNYVFSYLFITEIASAVSKGKNPQDVEVPAYMQCFSGCGLNVDCVEKMVENIKGKFTRNGELINTDANETVQWSALIEDDITNMSKAISDRQAGP